MPLNIDFLQVLLHMLNFVILAGGLTYLLYNPISNFLDQRREHFESIERENEEKAKENNRLKAEYEQKLKEANVQIAEMRQQAEKDMTAAAEKYISSAKERGDAYIAAAEKEAESRKEHILESAQSEMGDLVVSAVQKLICDTASPERDSSLYDAFIRLAGQDNADKVNNDEQQQ